MRLLNKNIFLALALLAVAQGCDKEPVGTPTTGVPIMLSATETGTKALLDNGTFKTTGNRIQIYDYVDGTKYFVDQIGPDVQGNTYGYDGVWPFVAGPHQWTPGTHKFFGWLAEDANMVSTADAAANTPNEFFDTGFVFDETSKVLTINSKEMTASTPQFDFLYSNIVSTEPQQEPVGLTFSHLFSAVYVTARNKDSENNITINKITINGLNNVKSSTINFSGTEPVVNYSDDENKEEGGYEFTINSETGLLTTTAKPLTDTYLIWPQTKEDFANASITVECTFSEDGKQTNEERTVSLSTLTPVESNYIWAPGKVNALNIVFDIDQITFIIQELVPWNETEKDIPVEL